MHACARAPVTEKERVRAAEQRLQRARLARLRSGNADSLSPSNLFQETLRDVKQINTRFILVADPILTERGDLLDTRLRHAL